MLGVKSSSRLQQVTSFLKVLFYLLLVICCFVVGPTHAPVAEVKSTLTTTVLYGSFILSFIGAMQLILGTYDGFDAPLYFAEEDTNPGKNIPRSLFGGAIVVIIVYVLLNIALLYVLPMSSFAGSKLAIADAAEVIFGPSGYTIITLLALLSLLGILNSQLMISSRILYGLSRAGFFFKQGTLINKGGTPYLGLIITALIGVMLLFTGSYEQLFALGAFIGIGASCMMYASLFKLRQSEPDLSRPYKAWGYPWIPLLMLLISIALFISYAFADTKNFLVILLITVLTWPAFRLIKPNTNEA
jgi:APA family basic amino acid/polyamine antiporter